MSHQEKHEIFDQYAKSHGYIDWSDLKADCDENLMTEDEFSLFMFEACDLVQEQQQKRIAERFSGLVHSTEVGDIFIEDFEKMKNSISNSENIVK